MKDPIKKTDWSQYTAEELKLKLIEFSNTYEALKTVLGETMDTMDKIENAYKEITLELRNRM
jgi:hypothetical protein